MVVEDAAIARILVVDDEPQMRRAVCDNLVAAGYVVAEAENGSIAETLLGMQPYDLVITDIIMPEKEGIETLQEIRRRHPRTAVIAMSGGDAGGGSGFLDIALKLGADRILRKPFRRAELLAVVEDALQSHKG